MGHCFLEPGCFPGSLSDTAAPTLGKGHATSSPRPCHVSLTSTQLGKWYDEEWASLVIIPCPSKSYSHWTSVNTPTNHFMIEGLGLTSSRAAANSFSFRLNNENESVGGFVRSRITKMAWSLGPKWACLQWSGSHEHVNNDHCCSLGCNQRIRRILLF